MCQSGMHRNQSNWGTREVKQGDSSSLTHYHPPLLWFQPYRAVLWFQIGFLMRGRGLPCLTNTSISLSRKGISDNKLMKRISDLDMTFIILSSSVRHYPTLSIWQHPFHEILRLRSRLWTEVIQHRGLSELWPASQLSPGHTPTSRHE